jgi:hypothetical protein
MDAISEIEKTSEYWRYRAQARNAPKATTDSRVALVSQQLGLSDADLEPFYYVNRKGSKKRYFDYPAFAERYGISVDWLRDGYLPAHPRNLEPLKTVRRTKNGRDLAQELQWRREVSHMLDNHTRKQVAALGFTPAERAAKAAVAAGKSTSASAVEISGWSGTDKEDKTSVPDRPFIEFMERLGAYVVKEFATGKEVDEIFDELIADAIKKSRRMPPLRPR